MRRTDYLLHALCGCIIAMTLYPFGLAWVAIGVTVAAGLKEIGDKYIWSGSADIIDFLSTLAGGIVGLTIELITYEFIL